MTKQTLSSSLTARLHSPSDPLFNSATQSPFLTAAGKGSLSKRKLSEWLSQDRLYAQAYIGFIGSLLAHAQLPSSHIPFDSHEDSLHWRIVQILKDSLDNIFRELRFFEDVAKKYGLSLEARSTDDPFGPVKATADYLTLFQRFSTPINHDDLRGLDWVLLNGLLVLWATEKCYLDAWRFAANQSDASKPAESDADGGALRDAFIPNWTSPEFADYVHQLRKLVDELMEQANLFQIKDAEDECRKLWEEVLDIEKRFWPNV
jgi:thiaminase